MNDYRSFTSKEEKRPRFFYGYTIIAASFLILLISWGTQYSFGVFFKPVLTEFDWSRAATSGAYSLNMILSGVFGIVAGRLSDRFGLRIILTVGGLLIGLGYLLMSQVNEIWQIYLIYGVLISIGMGGTAVPLLSNIARWFVKGRGLATGIVASGIGAGIIIMPPLANLLISSYNWRSSYIILGLISIILIVIIAQFLRRTPSQASLLNQIANGRKTEVLNLQAQGFSLYEALFNRTFWMICLMSLFFGFGLQAVMVHIVAHATDIGFSAAAAAMILSVIGIVSVGSKVGMGSLGDRIGSKNILILVFVLASLSFLWLRVTGELWMLYLFAAIFGICYGGFITVQSPLVADYFGLRAHGAIYGSDIFAANTGSALGSVVAGRIFDITGSYNWAFVLCAMLGVASLIFSLFLKAIRKK